MEKIKVTHYQKSGSIWYTDGGKLIITEKEYIVKYLFHTVARFEIEKTIATQIPTSIQLNMGIQLCDGTKEIDLYFFKKNAEKLYKIIDIQ